VAGEAIVETRQASGTTCACFSCVLSRFIACARATDTPETDIRWHRIRAEIRASAILSCSPMDAARLGAESWQELFHLTYIRLRRDLAIALAAQPRIRSRNFQARRNLRDNRLQKARVQRSRCGLWNTLARLFASIRFAR